MQLGVAEGNDFWNCLERPHIAKHPEVVPKKINPFNQQRSNRPIEASPIPR
jgi:hypothetical protein